MIGMRTTPVSGERFGSTSLHSDSIRSRCQLLALLLLCGAAAAEEGKLTVPTSSTREPESLVAFSTPKSDTP